MVFARRTPRPLTCRELAALLTERLEGTLPPALRRRVEAHLSACEDCAAYAEQFEQVVAALTALGGSGAEPDAAALDALLEAFRGRPPTVAG
jgi:anti-sigma factor RsiW